MNIGAITDDGIIYCIPDNYSNCGILAAIDTNTDTVTELDRNILPERGGDEDDGIMMWESRVAACDGFIYFMHHDARRIMKLDPYNNDAISSVGDDLGHGYFKYS